MAAYDRPMRTIANGLAAILLLIALVGIGFGFWAVASALSHRGSADGLLAALAVGSLPFLIGTVALAGATIAILCEEIVSELKLANEHALEGGQRAQPPTSWAAGPNP
jgi:ABC-type spermidine/putrescine transport system permease subunit II